MFCIENNRKTGGNRQFLTYRPKCNLKCTQIPTSWTYYVILDIWQYFWMVFEFPITTWGLCGVNYRANWAVLGHFSCFQRDNGIRWSHKRQLNTFNMTLRNISILRTYLKVVLMVFWTCSLHFRAGNRPKIHDFSTKWRLKVFSVELKYIWSLPKVYPMFLVIVVHTRI